MGKIRCCHGCEEERFPGCHASCERYKAERAALDRENEEIHKAKQRDAIRSEYEVGKLTGKKAWKAGWKH